LLDCPVEELKSLTPWEFFYFDRDSGQEAFRVELKGRRKREFKDINPIR
jgi:hypothetical protein